MENFSYDNIADDYDSKRKKPWIPLKDFLFFLSKNRYTFKGNCIDLGCANGRHFEIFKNSNNKIIGIDNSSALLKLALKRLKSSKQYSKIELNRIQLILADLKFIPIRTHSIQNVFSVATIHHVKEQQERAKVIKRLFDLLQEDGYLLITVWRIWHKRVKKHFIIDWVKRINPRYKHQQKRVGLKEFGDKYVPWTFTRKNETFYRFYHFFSKKEIKKLLQNFIIKEFKMMGGPTKEDNFFILAQKR
jgi:SAM-dependent methyltransferase